MSYKLFYFPNHHMAVIQKLRPKGGGGVANLVVHSQKDC